MLLVILMLLLLHKISIHVIKIVIIIRRSKVKVVVVKDLSAITHCLWFNFTFMRVVISMLIIRYFPSETSCLFVFFGKERLCEIFLNFSLLPNFCKCTFFDCETQNFKGRDKTYILTLHLAQLKSQQLTHTESLSLTNQLHTLNWFPYKLITIIAKNFFNRFFTVQRKSIKNSPSIFLSFLYDQTNE